MGIRLVGAALSANWSHLSERARLVLAQMCYVAKDVSTAGHAPSTYWGGHQALILLVLGQDPETLSEAELRTAQRMAGNGVVRQQAVAALRLMLNRAESVA